MYIRFPDPTPRRGRHRGPRPLDCAHARISHVAHSRCISPSPGVRGDPGRRGGRAWPGLPARRAVSARRHLLRRRRRGPLPLDGGSRGRAHAGVGRRAGASCLDVPRRPAHPRRARRADGRVARAALGGTARERRGKALLDCKRWRAGAVGALPVVGRHQGGHGPARPQHALR